MRPLRQFSLSICVCVCVCVCVRGQKDAEAPGNKRAREADVLSLSGSSAREAGVP